MYFRHQERPLWNLHKEMIKRRSITRARDIPAIATALSKCSGFFAAPELGGGWGCPSIYHIRLTVWAVTQLSIEQPQSLAANLFPSDYLGWRVTGKLPSEIASQLPIKTPVIWGPQRWLVFGKSQGVESEALSHLPSH